MKHVSRCDGSKVVWDDSLTPFREMLELDRVVCGAYGPESYGEGYFDCIYSHHVLEHVARPLKVLRAVERHLKPGGRFLLQVPQGVRKPDGNYESIGHGHLFAFTPDYLVRTLRSVGFEIAEVLTYASLDELPADRRDATGALAIWGDYPGALSILATKPG
jgi:SAM-dependent methyltransferase